MNPVKFLADNYKVIEETIKVICLLKNMRGEEMDEFAAIVKSKLIENDYKKIRDFKGKSSFKTYLQTIINSIFIDELRRKKGRWRPSKASVEIGEAAVKLEELIYRDKHTTEDACTILTEKLTFPISVKEAEEISHNLEDKRRKYERRDQDVMDLNNAGDDLLTGLSSSDPPPEEIMLNREFLELTTELMNIVAEMRGSLSKEDNLMLKMGFEDGIGMSEIARVLRQERTIVDRRMKKILSAFKEKMLFKGKNMQDVLEALKRMEDSGEIHV